MVHSKGGFINEQILWRNFSVYCNISVEYLMNLQSSKKLPITLMQDYFRVQVEV